MKMHTQLSVKKSQFSHPRSHISHWCYITAQMKINIRMYICTYEYTWVTGWKNVDELTEWITNGHGPPQTFPHLVSPVLIHFYKLLTHRCMQLYTYLCT